jgi:hypothetical protein
MESLYFDVVKTCELQDQLPWHRLLPGMDTFLDQRTLPLLYALSEKIHTLRPPSTPPRHHTLHFFLELSYTTDQRSEDSPLESQTLSTTHKRDPLRHADKYHQFSQRPVRLRRARLLTWSLHRYFRLGDDRKYPERHGISVGPRQHNKKRRHDHMD